MRTCKQIFEEELSGEPLTQESVIEGMMLAQLEVLEDIAWNEDSFTDTIDLIWGEIYNLKQQLNDKENI